MNTLSARIHQVVSLIHSVKSKNLAWQGQNQGQQLKLAHDRILAENKLAAELAKRSVALAHEIEMLKTSQDAELTMLKTRCKADIKDYQQYLEALSQLKITLKTSYAHLPDAITHTIHHHAKTLLDAMWEADNLAEKLRLETRFIGFMMTIHEEARLSPTATPSDSLPENTLRLIKQEQGSMFPS